MTLKLNLGCGDDLRPAGEGWLNVDKRPPTGEHDDVAFLQTDLDETPWPWHDATVDHVLMDNVLEHTNQPEAWIEEAHRVLRAGGTLRVIVPHYQHPDAHIAGHKSTFSPEWMRRWTQPPDHGDGGVYKHFFDELECTVHHSGLFAWHQRKYLGREFLAKDPHTIHWLLQRRSQDVTKTRSTAPLTPEQGLHPDRRRRR